MSDLRRPAKSAAEISALPPLGTTQGMQHVRDNGEGFAPETLVYIMREALARKEPTLFELGAMLLVGRRVAGRWQGGHVEGTMARLARHYGFDGDVDMRHDFRSECLSVLFAAIHAGLEREHFLEERFGRAFKTRCIDVARRLHAQRRQENRLLVNDVDDVAMGDTAKDHRTDALEDGLLASIARPEHERVVLAAMRALPPRQSQAAMLRWIERRPIEGNGAHTVANIMDISPTRVHQLLQQALRALRANEALRAIARGEA
jgi:DNA-directed RNA polymerase specialized sigma24 family protein